MKNLSRWLRREIERRGLTQNAAAVHAGVAQGTLSAMLARGHVPKAETLLRLADYFETPREEVLRLAGHLPGRRADPGASEASAAVQDHLVRELLEEFRKVPDEWKEVAIAHVELVAHMAQHPPVRIIGGDLDDEEGPPDAQEDEEAA